MKPVIKTSVFPDDFHFVNHEVVKGAKQWLINKPNGSQISIVGGGNGLYGDGINTFEVWDFEEEEPRPFQTKEQVNKYLNSFILE